MSAPRKLFLPKRNYSQLPTVDFCLACLGFCPADGYYYFVQVCGVSSCIPPRYECVLGAGVEGGQCLSTAAAAAAVQLVECGKPSSRQSKLLMSVQPWLRVVDASSSHFICYCPSVHAVAGLWCLPMAKSHLFLLTFWQLSALQTQLGVCVCAMCVWVLGCYGSHSSSCGMVLPTCVDHYNYKFRKSAQTLSVFSEQQFAKVRQ